MGDTLYKLMVFAIALVLISVGIWLTLGGQLDKLEEKRKNSKKNDCL